MASLAPSPKLQEFDVNSHFLVGGKLYTYAAGTTAPIVTYVDRDGVTQNTNPIILDSRGSADIWLVPGTLYKYLLTDSNDVPIPGWPVDNIVAAETSALAGNISNGTDAAKGSALVGFYDNLAPSYLKTVSDMLNFQPISALRFIDKAKHAGIRAYTNNDDLSSFLQDGIDVVQDAGGPELHLPSGRYIIGGNSGLDSKANGIHVPFTNVFNYQSHIKLTGDGRSTLLLPADNNITVIRWSDSLGELKDFAISDNGKTGVTGISFIGSNTASTTLAEHIDWNVMSRVDINGCAEGIELESPSGGGCYFNRFEYCVLYNNTRHIRLRDNSTIGGANRNSFIGINMQGGTIGVYNDGADTNAFVQCGFDGITTAFQQTLIGSLKGLGTNDTNLIACTWEDCTTDLISPNRRMSIVGGNCGSSGAVTLANGIDQWVGGDATYRLREMQLGDSSTGLFLQPRQVAFLSQPQIATSSNQGGSYPFNKDGILILQGRQVDTADGDVGIFTGSSSALRVKITGIGNLAYKPSIASAVLTNGATITTAGERVSRVSPAAAVTGIIMQSGTEDGQLCTVVNESTTANSVTFAGGPTSHVAEGAAAVIAGFKNKTFVWVTASTAWFMN